MAGAFGLSIPVLEVGILSRVGGYVSLEVVAEVFFTLASVIRPDISPAALADSVGDLPRSQ